MTPINNLKVYVDGMKKALDDKRFFVSMMHPDIDTVIDYGCGDGTLLDSLPSDLNKYGYDLNPDMVLLCERKGINMLPDLERIKDLAHFNPDSTALILSSVLHEINSYCTPKEIKEFWNTVRDLGVKQIYVRDMVNFKSNDVINASDFELLYKNSNEAQLKRMKEFEEIWGSLVFERNFIHYLLKYRYVDNWKREKEENYLSVDLGDLLSLMNHAGYKESYMKLYTLPFLQKKVYDDFEIWLTGITHGKFVFTKQ